MNYTRFKFAALALACLSLWSPRLLAQEKVAKTPAQSNSETAEMPAGESLMEAYADAIGVNANLKKFRTRRSEGTIEMKEAGITGKLTTIQQAPNKLMVRMEIPGIGEIMQGTDGETAWESSVISGNRILAGEEKKETMRRALFESDAQWKDLYESVKTIGTEKVGEKDTWVVELKPKDSTHLQTNYFDKKSKLLVQSKMQITSPMGAIAVEMAFDEFREVDGVRMPFTTTQKVLGQTQVMKLTKVTHNEELPAGTFDRPKN